MNTSGRRIPWVQLVALGLSVMLVVISYNLPADIQTDLETGLMSFSMGSYQVSMLQILRTLFVIIVLIWSIRLIIGMIDRALGRSQFLRSSMRTLIIRLLQGMLYFIGFLIILTNLGIDLTVLAVFSGTIGIGLGFGLQKIASNFISGVILTSENSIKEGDLLELDDGTVGFVRRIGARQILLEGLDSKEIMVPNEEFINTRVTNWTLTDARARVDVLFGVAYGSDLRQVQSLVLELARQHPRCSSRKEPSCHVTEFADSSINYVLYFWIDDVTQGRVPVRSDLLLQIWETFAQNDITVPFPQRDLHLIQQDSDQDHPVLPDTPQETPS